MKIFGKVKFDLIIAGLGNPGDNYSRNRHNIGRMAVEFLCVRQGVKLKKKFGGYRYAKVKIENNHILVVAPDSFMNNSGESLSYLSGKYKVATENIVVIADEYNFPVGRIHLKSGGGDGGHNGIRSVIDELGSTEFMRLRCGIGKNFKAGELTSYVLSDFGDEEWDEAEAMAMKAAEAVETIAKLGKARAMSAVNSGELLKD